jgi:3-phosphoshikimate 1-carboxyvinyltransferase
VRLTLGPSGPLRGRLRVPGDKSITHRALLLAAYADGESTLAGVNPGTDCAALARALRELGAPVRRTGAWPTHGGRAHLPGADPAAPGYVVRGAGGRWREPAGVLDLGNSGTALRLLAGVVSGAPIFCVLDGDASLRRRPMARITEPLKRMGARLDGPGDGARAPLAVRGGGLRGIRHVSPVASAQVKSALLLAALAADGETHIVEPRASRDHTERLLPRFGARLLAPGSATDGGETVGVVGPQRLTACDVAIPGDFSAAAFWIVAALVVPGSEIVVEDVGLNPKRTGLLAALARMGAAIEVEPAGERDGEPVGSIRARHGPLRATDITAGELPTVLDEIPVWAVACAFAEGVSTLSGAAELRAKESDRLRGTARGLAALGAEAVETADGLVIRGVGPAAAGASPLAGGRASAAGDHRLAMAFLVAGLASERGAQVTGAGTVDTSYPGFYPSAKALASSR